MGSKVTGSGGSEDVDDGKGHECPCQGGGSAGRAVAEGGDGAGGEEHQEDWSGEVYVSNFACHKETKIHVRNKGVVKYSRV